MSGCSIIGFPNPSGHSAQTNPHCCSQSAGYPVLAEVHVHSSRATGIGLLRQRLLEALIKLSILLEALAVRCTLLFWLSKLSKLAKLASQISFSVVFSSKRIVRLGFLNLTKPVVDGYRDTRAVDVLSVFFAVSFYKLAVIAGSV